MANRATSPGATGIGHVACSGDPGVGWCVEDCRPFKICPSPSRTCEEQTGLCVP